MKKIFCFLMIFLMTGMAYAIPMCRKDDTDADTVTVGLVLDPSINGISNSYDGGNSYWMVGFANSGTIVGRATCLATGGTQYVANTTLVADPGSQTGTYCWCRMEHPAVSAWVFNYNYSSTSSCARDCAYTCSLDIRFNATMHSAMFNSIGQYPN